MKKKLLFVRVFGIGNAVMSIPAIKHYRDAGGFDVTVLVGTTPDDFGAKEVLSRLSGVRVIDRWPGDETFDVAVASIPYDGRWGFPLKVSCEKVFDGRPRPDPTTFGFSSWELHEAEYQLLMAEEVTSIKSREYENQLLDDGPLRLDTSFWDGPITDNESVYLGIGRKYDQQGFWEQKHWGDENFVELAKMILDNHPEKRIICTGSQRDLVGTGRVLIHALREYGDRFTFHRFTADPLTQSFRVLATCGSYIGNDTGMMHVAASMDKLVVAIFNLEGTLRKNHPLCSRWAVLEGHADPVTPMMVYNTWRDICTQSSSPAAPAS